MAGPSLPQPQVLQQEDNPLAERPIQLPELPQSQKQREQIAYFLRASKTGPTIKDLVISDSEAPIVMVIRGSDIKPTIALNGSFQRPGWTLFVLGGDQALPVDFVVYAHLQGRINEITLIATGPKGEREIEKIYVYSPNARTFHVVSAWEDLLFSAGVAGFSYAQSTFGVYEAIQAIASVRYSTPDSDSLFGFLGSAEMTVWGIAMSPVNTSPQLFEGKADLTIRTNRNSSQRMHYRALLGGTYLTMFSNGSPFGFSDLMVMEFGVQGRYIASAKDDWIGEFRYMPVGGVSDWGQFAINTSLALSRLLNDSRRIEFALCYSFYKWLPATTISIETSLLTFRVGLTL